MGLKEFALGLGMISGEPDPAALEDLHTAALKVHNQAPGIQTSVSYVDPVIQEGHRASISRSVERLFELHEVDVDSCSVAEQLARETAGVISRAAATVSAVDGLDSKMTDVFRANVIEFGEAAEALSDTCDMGYVNYVVDDSLNRGLGG